MLRYRNDPQHGALMRYALDPRNPAGQSVNVVEDISGRYCWHPIDPTTERPVGLCNFENYRTREDALAGARSAAGFEHVAERACNAFWTDWKNAALIGNDPCLTCAWPRDAHTPDAAVSIAIASGWEPEHCQSTTACDPDAQCTCGCGDCAAWREL